MVLLACLAWLLGPFLARGDPGPYASHYLGIDVEEAFVLVVSTLSQKRESCDMEPSVKSCRLSGSSLACSAARRSSSISTSVLAATGGG